MATANLGRVGFVNKGTYSGVTVYKVNDIVTYNSGTYACIQAHTGQLPTVTAYWQNWVANDKALDSEVVHKTGDTMTGNLNFSGTGLKITGDFTSGGTANTAISTNVTNGYTSLPLLPNGTGAIASFQAFSSSDMLNSSYAWFGCTSNFALIQSAKVGSGAYLPLAFNTGGGERLRIDTSGNVLVTGSGGLGYGTGSGGTVTQLTSKVTAVTLNKPSGKIIMNNASLASGAIVTFSFTNSTMTNPQDILLLQCLTINYTSYEIKAVGFGTNESQITIKNVSGGALAEALIISFTVIKGATA